MLTKEDYDRVESEQKQHHNEILFQSNQCEAVMREELTMFQMLKPTIKQDGNQWCVLYGDDLQSGIAGFGDTPYKAIIDWNGAFQREAVRAPATATLSPKIC